VRRRVVILGSTGSIGTQALEVIAANPDRFEVIALAAGGAHPELLAKQAIEFDAPVVAVSRGSAAQDVQLALYAEAQRRGYAEGDHGVPRLLIGRGAAAEVAALPADVVLNGMTGAVGLEPTLAALAAGTTLALANKESLIIGGDLVTSAAKPGQIVPVDSEHSALAQALRGERPDDVRRLILTASGGPFRGRSRADLADVTPEQALAHPTWDMGPVVTINSATLVNKGLEVIEAHLLFDIGFDRIDVVVHPTSVVHSMVEFVDGSTMAQASPPDMKLPIALGLAWPDRVPGVAAPCAWTQPNAWEFFPLDDAAFPAVQLARRAGEFARTAPAVFNAANESCVEAFISGDLPFLGIVDTVTSVVEEHIGDLGAEATELSLDGVLSADAWARDRACALIGSAVSPHA
jgi:1-deoxy-D-xylulose-5-phosphate reductoisomerase